MYIDVRDSLGISLIHVGRSCFKETPRLAKRYSNISLDVRSIDTFDSL